MTGKVGIFNENGKLVSVVGETIVDTWRYVGDPARITSTACVDGCTCRGCPGMIDNRCPFSRGSPIPTFSKLFEKYTIVVKTE